MMESSKLHEEPNWLKDMRAGAALRFVSMAWPQATEEEWRRSDLSGLGLDSWLSPASPPSACLVTARIPEGLKARGVRLLPMDEAARELGGAMQALLDAAASYPADRFEAWNVSAWTGSLLWIPPGLELLNDMQEPILVETRVAGRLCQPRLLVVVGEASRVTVVHRLVGDTWLSGAYGAASHAAGSLVNAAVDLRLEPGAGLDLFESQDLDPSVLYFRSLRSTVADDASLHHLDAEIGARFVKSRVSCSIEGSGADVRLDGVWHCQAGQHIDLRTVQRHAKPRSSSRASYKAAVEAGGNSVHQGLIEVAEGASGTDAFLSSRNLLLGKGARADSLPSLRIGDNDVRCSHGSATGQLSREELFYLESRGFSEEEAREFLVTGFFEELLASAPPVFAEEVLARLRSRLRPGSGAATKAA